jgi:hypothetical protein
MEGILIGDLLIRPGSVINRDGRHESFKIEEIEGVPESIEKVPEAIRVDEFSPVEIGLDLKQLNWGKAVFRDVLQPDNPLTVEDPGVDPSLYQIQDRIFRDMGPAVALEITRVGGIAVFPDIDFGKDPNQYSPEPSDFLPDQRFPFNHRLGEVFEQKQLFEIQGPVPDILVVNIDQESFPDRQARVFQDVILEGQVVEVDFFDSGTSLDFIEVPILPDFSQDIGLDENPVELKGRFVEDPGSGGDFGLGQLELVVEGQSVIGDQPSPGETIGIVLEIYEPERERSNWPVFVKDEDVM